MKNYLIKYLTRPFELKKWSGLSILLLVGICFSRCAQIIPLSGGDKDTQAPKPVMIIPANASVNVPGKNILIEFDEYIQLRDLNNQMVITPQLKELPEVTARGKSLAIEFRENLKPNTTYYLNFGNAITDLHEGNALSGFEYVFSTGAQIDSLKLSGKITDAFTLQPAKDVWVLLYESKSDSAVYNEKPSYLSKTDADGRYTVHYIKAGKYKVVALKDNNKNFIYDADEQIGFYYLPQAELKSNDTIDMLLFKENPSKVYLKKTSQPNYGKAELIFNAPLEDMVELSFKTGGTVLDQSKYKSFIRPGRDTVTIYYHDLFGDTVHTVIRHGSTADTTRLLIASEADVLKQKEKKRLPFDLFQSFNPGTPFPYFQQPSFRTGRMFRQFDPGKTYLAEETDTIRGDKIDYAIVQPDSLYLNNRLKPGKNYQVFFGPGAFTDYLGIQNDTIQYKFKTQEADYYSAITLNLKLPAQHNWILQAYNSKGKLVKEVAFDTRTDQYEGETARKIKLDKLDPDTYLLKMIDDSNADKKYTTGSYATKTDPERVINYSQVLKLSADWEMESEWKIEK